MTPIMAWMLHSMVSYLAFLLDDTQGQGSIGFPNCIHVTFSTNYYLFHSFTLKMFQYSSTQPSA